MKFKTILFTALFLLLTTPSLFAAQATLSWNPNSESDLAGYKVYWGTSTGSYQWSLDVKDVNSYTISNLTEGESYFFAATAYDFTGNESGYSNEVSYDVPIPDTTPPADPTGTDVKGVNIITWNENQESNIGGYIVFRDNSWFAETIQTRIVLKGRDKHKGWKDYFVKAFNTSGMLSGPGDTIRVKFRGNRIIKA